MKKLQWFYDVEQRATISTEQIFSEYQQARNAGGIDDSLLFVEYLIDSLTMFGGTLEEYDEKKHGRMEA